VSVGVYIYLCVFFNDARPSGPIGVYIYLCVFFNDARPSGPIAPWLQ
jgi:hypothetical protein